MPSFKYVIELSDQDKTRLMEIVKKRQQPSPDNPACEHPACPQNKQSDKYMTVSEDSRMHTAPHRQQYRL